MLDQMAEMNTWFHNCFYPSYNIEIDCRAAHLPPAVEADLIQAYKAWFESGDKVSAPWPPAPSTVKPTGGNALAHASTAGKGWANVKVGGLKEPPWTTAGHLTPARAPSQLPITSIQDFPPIVSDWAMLEGHQSGDSFNVAKNTINIDSSSDNAGGGWLTTPPRSRHAHQAAQHRQRSFVAAATLATGSTAPMPISTHGPAVPVTMDLSKADLDQLSKPDVIWTFNQCFNHSVPANTKLSKEALITSYIAKTNAPLPKAKPAPCQPLPLTTTQYTVVCNPTTAGLQKVTSRTHDAPSEVRTLQRALRQQFLSGQKVPVDLIGGCWGAQASANFILIFNGFPGNVAVMQCRKVFHDFFGMDCTIVPQQGYLRMLLCLVPICRDDNSSLPSSDVLVEEIRRNFLFQDITMFCPPHWLKADVLETTRHGSVVVTFLDEDGSCTKNLACSPIFMFGGTARACKFNSLPLLYQCEWCWRLGHNAKRCPRPKTLLVCSICSGAHSAVDHQFKCKDVKKHSTLKCDCPCSCINCLRESPATAKGHLSTDHSCPLRAKYCAPLTCMGDSTDEEVHASIPMVVEDPLTFSNEIPATAMLEPAPHV